MKTVIDIENVMACGCSNSILDGLSSMQGVFGAAVDPRGDRVIVDHTDEVSPQELSLRLVSMGYRLRRPEHGTDNQTKR